MLNQTAQPPVISRQRLDHLLKLTFADALRIAVEDEEYMLAHQMQQELIKLEK